VELRKLGDHAFLHHIPFNYKVKTKAHSMTMRQADDIYLEFLTWDR